MRTRLTLLLSMLLSFALVAAACGDDDSDPVTEAPDEGVSASADDMPDDDMPDDEAPADMPDDEAPDDDMPDDDMPDDEAPADMPDEPPLTVGLV